MAFSFFLILTAGISSLIFRRLQNEKQEVVSDLEKIKSSAREISPESEMGSLDSDEVRLLLKKHESEIERGRMDYRSLFELTKKKLVKERNLVL